MNISIVCADDLVIIDDQPQRFDLSSYSFPDAFWALQWRNDQGEIEFNNAEPNQMITELPEWTTAIIVEHARLTEQDLQPPPPPTAEEQYQEMIHQRNQLLDSSDWIIMRQKDQRDLSMETVTISSEGFLQFLEWRQALRDMPEKIQPATPTTFTELAHWPWPAIPEELKPEFPDYPPGQSQG